MRAKARKLDKTDELRSFRMRFALPKDKIYLCNHSLGLPPIKAFSAMQEQMQRWADYGADGWFHGQDNWYTSLENSVRSFLAPLLGAKEHEVAAMNSLTVNLHLLMVSFYQPAGRRYKILIDSPAFPSDLYALKSHIARHGLDPENAIVTLKPRPGEFLLHLEDIAETLEREGSSVALVFLNGVNFLTGQVFDLKSITRLAHQQGCIVGCDLAHAAGNIPLRLNQWEVDFAVGCSYKYLCSGPGAPGFAYVHESHHNKGSPRFSGWWGNDPTKRFDMQLQPEFIPYGGASSWQVSTSPVLALTPFRSALEIFHEAGMERLRKKSKLQTAFLLELLDALPNHRFTLITARDPSQRGCQLSLMFHGEAEKTLAALEENAVICDFRPPNIIRVSPSPLYNTFDELCQFTCRLASL